MILKNSIDSSTFVNIESSSIGLASGPMAISVDRELGVFVNGPVSISSPPSSIRIGGVFKFHPLTMTGIPSTIITPVPTFQIDVPMKNVGIMAAISSMVLSTARG